MLHIPSIFITTNTIIPGNENLNVIDCFSGLPMNEKSCVKLLNDKYYDATIFALYILKMEDCRDPYGYELTSEDIDLIADSFPEDDLISKNGILELKQSMKISDQPAFRQASKFFGHLVTICTEEVINSCKLENIISMDELQLRYNTIHNLLIKSFAGLLSYDPLEAANSANTLKIEIMNESASSASSDSYIMEPSAFIPISITILNVCSSVLQSFQSRNTRDAINHLLDVSPAILGLIIFS